MDTQKQLRYDATRYGMPPTITRHGRNDGNIGKTKWMGDINAYINYGYTPHILFNNHREAIGYYEYVEHAGPCIRPLNHGCIAWLKKHKLKRSGHNSELVIMLPITDPPTIVQLPAERTEQMSSTSLPPSEDSASVQDDNEHGECSEDDLETYEESEEAHNQPPTEEELLSSMITMLDDIPTTQQDNNMVVEAPPPLVQVEKPSNVPKPKKTNVAPVRLPDVINSVQSIGNAFDKLEVTMKEVPIPKPFTEIVVPVIPTVVPIVEPFKKIVTPVVPTHSSVVPIPKPFIEVVVPVIPTHSSVVPIPKPLTEIIQPPSVGQVVLTTPNVINNLSTDLSTDAMDVEVVEDSDPPSADQPPYGHDDDDDDDDEDDDEEEEEEEEIIPEVQEPIETIAPKGSSRKRNKPDTASSTNKKSVKSTKKGKDRQEEFLERYEKFDDSTREIINGRLVLNIWKEKDMKRLPKIMKTWKEKPDVSKASRIMNSINFERYYSHKEMSAICKTEKGVRIADFMAYRQKPQGFGTILEKSIDIPTNDDLNSVDPSTLPEDAFKYRVFPELVKKCFSST